jgi:cellulose synthase/poly-beta-1,6-N-acetylglucosamine synthase-like glycosyltransferase
MVGWNRNFNSIPREDDEEVFISVIIPVRNEEKNIIQLLESLSQQQYKNFEVIFVDDHSEDKSKQLIEKLNYPFARCLVNEGVGKKKALSTGINNSSGQIIVTTDADCSLPSHWLSAINNYFSDPSIMLLIGGVSMHGDASAFSKMQQVEFSSLIGSAASTAALRIPSMCNGANLSFRRSAYEEVNGYEGNFQIASGDDEFLMRKILKHFPNGIRFLADHSAVVRTSVQHSIDAFFAQRIRWAGKWKANNSVHTLIIAFFVLAFQVASVLALVNFFLSGNLLYAGLIVMKIILEGIALRKFCHFLKTPWSWTAFLLLQLLYPFYVVTVAVAANFLSYSWKGRSYTN